MKFSTSAVLVLTAIISAVSSSPVPGATDYYESIVNYISLYSTNSAWWEYIQTHDFTTPVALESWISHYETLTDMDEISSLANNFPTEDLSDFLSQYVPTSLIDNDGNPVITEVVETDASDIETSVPEETLSDRSTITAASTQRSSTSSGSDSVSESASDDAAESAEGTRVSQGAAMNTMVPYAAVVGLSGIVAGLVLF